MRRLEHPRSIAVDVPHLLAALGIEAERRGHEWWACCPFHVEKTASWTMRDEPGTPKHGLYRCYGCKVGGAPVGLVGTLLGLDAKEAAAWIASRAPGAARPTGEQIRVVSRGRGFFRIPGDVVFAPLAEWVTPVRRYAEQRGLTAAQVERWGVGYAVDGRLAGRVVFPLRDGKDRPVGYTARAFDGSKKRYLEPRDDEHADKGAIFGEQHWPHAAERTEVVVTEGAIDALAVEAVGFRRGAFPAVAALTGSQLLPGHVMRLSTFPAVVVASDMDAAGRGLEEQLRAQLGRWCKVRRAHLPPGRDCNDLMRGDPNLLVELLWPIEALG